MKTLIAVAACLLSLNAVASEYSMGTPRPESAKTPTVKLNSCDASARSVTNRACIPAIKRNFQSDSAAQSTASSQAVPLPNIDPDDFKQPATPQAGY